jgi:hypothetical protein
VPDEREFLIELAVDAHMRIRFRGERGHIVEFMVQLEARILDEWMPVVRYDNHHGSPHVDTHDRWGREIDKRWLSMSNADALTHGMNDIKQNWPQYIAQFMKGRLR